MKKIQLPKFILRCLLLIVETKSKISQAFMAPGIVTEKCADKNHLYALVKVKARYNTYPVCNRQTRDDVLLVFVTEECKSVWRSC